MMASYSFWLEPSNDVAAAPSRSALQRAALKKNAARRQERSACVAMNQRPRSAERPARPIDEQTDVGAVAASSGHQHGAAHGVAPPPAAPATRLINFNSPFYRGNPHTSEKVDVSVLVQPILYDSFHCGLSLPDAMSTC